MFKKILIANRGEIACRIIHSAHKLNIQTVAIYSEADTQALHTHLADESYFIGPAPAKESYLRSDKIIDIALKSRAEAIHPGYGFLSENSEFALQCAKAGITFIGPSVDALRTMGSKSASKALMEKIGVPILPGYHGEDMSLEILTKETKRIGFPLIIKASGGGGGKGMRIVLSQDALIPALESAQREAMASFQDARLLLERYVEAPRHVEVQIFGDGQGTYVHLFERDCSIQRRYQKIIEESPAPHLSDKTRESLYAAALKIAQAVDYQGAGTVEFLVDQEERFYFMEMNTRLQVEHPVTEMVTGLDLVEWQLKVASGDSLPLTQKEITRKGHALEARVCAENPIKDFLPATGALSRFSYPTDSPHVRYETGVHQGSALTVHYDSMISKVVAWGETRLQAIDTLIKALTVLKISGVHTNKSYLLAILNHKTFREGGINTGFLQRYHKGLLKTDYPPEKVFYLAAWAVVYLPSQASARHFGGNSLFWRLNQPYETIARFSYGDEEISINVRIESSIITFYRQKTSISGRIFISESGSVLEILDERIPLKAFQDGAHFSLDYLEETYTFDRIASERETFSFSQEEGHLEAPMPGRVSSIKTKPGDHVHAGDLLLTLEAMKMEHPLKAPFEGIVVELPFSVGDLVEEGTELVTVSPLAAENSISIS